MHKAKLVGDRAVFAIMLILATAIIFSPGANAQAVSNLSPLVRQYVKVDAPVVALTHVRVIDGTGAAARADQTLVIRNGKIAAIGDAASTPAPDGAQVLDLSGYSVIPGLVGMHDHLFYTADTGHGIPGPLLPEIAYTGPRLYLAAGVTTMRTTGSVEPYTDLNLRRFINEGKTPGPKMDVTGPYLEGPDSIFPQMHELTGPDDARKLVDYWADQGVTSFKAYMHITRAELGAAIEEAHKRGIKVTGHLCSVGFREAVNLGIDDLEHGFFVDTEFDPSKQPDVCPRDSAKTLQAFLDVSASSDTAQAIIRDIVSHHVAITSTLPVFELDVPNRPPLEQRVMDAMSPQARSNYLELRIRVHSRPGNMWGEGLKHEMEFERAFVKAGGMLLAGPDPTGIGGVLPGFGDQREVELLVEAGFTPLEAIHIATSNGAEYLGQLASIGTLAPGKIADIAVIRGDPSANIADIEKVEIVFKDGVGYDSGKLIDSVHGLVGLR